MLSPSLSGRFSVAICIKRWLAQKVGKLALYGHTGGLTRVFSYFGGIQQRSLNTQGYQKNGKYSPKYGLNQSPKFISLYHISYIREKALECLQQNL
jgi:hypothetical protein